MKWSKAKPADDGSPRIDLAVPAFGYKNHVGIDRRHGLIRTWTATDAARHDGAQLPNLVSKANTASDVWADTAYRSRPTRGTSPRTASLAHPPQEAAGQAHAGHVARANGAKSKVRAAVEHVFAARRGRWAWSCAPSAARATVKIRQSLPGKEETVLGARVITPLVTDEALRVSDELYHAVRPMLAVSFRPGLNSRPGSSSPRSCRVSTALLALNRIERGPARTGGRRRQAEGCHRGLDLLSNPFLSANLRGNA